MSESSPTPPAEGDEWANFDLRKFVVETIHSVEFGDAIADILENRVLAIEQCVAAPWYRRPLLWHRLRRAIRASVITWDPAYIAPGDFRGRRQEWAMEAAVKRYGTHGWKPRFGPIDQPGRAAQEQPGDDGADPGAGYLP